MKRYELSAGRSHKFWQIEQSGNKITITFGRIGTDGQKQTKTFPSVELAKAATERLSGDKIKKGYRLMPRPDQAESTSPSSSLRALETALKKFYPEVAESLHPPAGAADLASLEVLCGGKLPDALRELYAWHNGCDGPLFGGYLFLSIKDIKRVIKQLQPRFKRLIPFLDDESGNFYAFDLDGLYQGPVGQIVRSEHETGDDIGFHSIEKWLETARALAKKQVLLGEDDDQFFKIVDKLNAGFPHRGGPELAAARKKAQELLDADKYQQALLATDKILATCPQDPDAFEIRWQAFSGLGKLDEALESIDREIELRKVSVNPDVAAMYRTYKWKAKLLLRAKRYEEVDPVIETQNSLRQELSKKLGMWDNSLSADLWEAWMLLGKARRLSGRTLEACRAYEEGFKYQNAEPSVAELHKHLDYARCLQDSKQKEVFDATRHALMQAVKNNPKD